METNEEVSLDKNELSKKDNNGDTAFVYALYQRRVKYANLMMATGLPLAELEPNTNNNSDEKQTDENKKPKHNALWSACAFGDYSIVNKLIESGNFDVNEQNSNEFNYTALHYLLKTDNENDEMIKILNKLLSLPNININITDSKDRTPLDCAIIKGHLKCIEILCQCNGKIDFTMGDAWYVAHVSNRLDIAKILFKYYKLWDFERSVRINCYLGNVESLKWLIEIEKDETNNIKIDINTTNKAEMTAPMLAAQRGYLNCIEAIAEWKGNEVNWKDVIRSANHGRKQAFFKQLIELIDKFGFLAMTKTEMDEFIQQLAEK